MPSILIDTHCDVPQRLLDASYDLASPLNGGNFNFASAKAGGLGAEIFAIWAEPKANAGRFAQRTMELIDAVYQQAAAHPDRMLLVTTPEGILRAHQEQKLAVMMGIEGGHSIENSLGLLRNYYRLGVRYMTLTWSNSNGWADSSGDEHDPSVAHTADGLSPFGVQVIAEMNRIGMMVDISHVADRTFWRVLQVSRAPIFASHSGARAITDAPRNMTDDMLRAVADAGGVVMVNFYSAFISQTYRDAAQRQSAEVQQAVDALHKAKASHAEEEALRRSYADRIARPPLSDLIDHIDYIAKLIGVDRVGIGSDFDGVNGQLPQGIDSPADLPKITEALRARGYSEKDRSKIMGGNFLRYFAAVHDAARHNHAHDALHSI